MINYKLPTYFTFLLLIIIIIILTIKYKHLYWKRQNIPYIKPHCIFGNIKSLLMSKKSVGLSIFDIYNNFREKNVKFGGFYMLTTPALIILDPNLIKNILIKDFEWFHDRNVYSNDKTDPLSGHLFAAEGVKWRRIRQNITPVFSSGKNKAMMLIIEKLARKLNNVINENCHKSIDIKCILGRYSLDVIANCVFGISINALDNQKTDFYKYSNMFLSTSMKSNIKMAFGMLYSNVLRFLNVKTMDKNISDFFISIFRDNCQRNDFMQLYFDKQCKKRNVKSDSQTSNSIDFYDMAAQAFLFFIAGYETSTQSLVYCLYELSLNKIIQKRLRNEIRSWLRKCDDNLCYDTVMSMEYLDLVLKETLRKYPVAPVLNRKCTNDYRIPKTDCVVEKGTPVWISILGLHMDPKFYKNPEIFDPERFNKLNKNTKPYLPFGSGPRNCIGSRFALMQLKTTLVALLSNFEFDIDSKLTKLPVEFGTQGILLDSKESIYLKVQKN